MVQMELSFTEDILGAERVESGSEEGSMRYPGPLDAGLSLSVSYPLGSGPPCSMTVESFR